MLMALEKCRASFETAASRPLRMTLFFNATTYRHAEERPGEAGARLEARTMPMQRILAQPHGETHRGLSASPFRPAGLRRSSR